MNKKLSNLLIIMILTFSASALASDLAKEKRWADQVVDALVRPGVDLPLKGKGVLEVIECRLEVLELAWSSDDFDTDDVVDPVLLRVECDAPRADAIGYQTFGGAADCCGGTGWCDFSIRSGDGSWPAGRQRAGDGNDLAAELFGDPSRDLVGNASDTFAANDGRQLAVAKGYQTHADGGAREELFRQLAIPIDELGDS